MGRTGQPTDHAILQERGTGPFRAAETTYQLLAFASKQIICPKVLDLNEAISSVLKILRRLLREDIRVAWCPGSTVWPIRIAPSQIDQILANLAINARDAITGVGRITVETANVRTGDALPEGTDELIPGDYVRLSVSDDGCGMDQETRKHVFEPFFTTKQVGEGTGLRLATVYGIARLNDGHVTVTSSPGAGSTFTILFPRVMPAKAVQQPQGVRVSPDRTILLAEDEDSS